ncbi:MAG: undecaprenyl phosphate translocase family protein, partial [Lachnospiraceae bacterium]
LIQGTKQERISAIKYLIKLGLGWVIGMGLAVTVLAALFEKGIYQVSSLFIGFILFAIPVMIYEERTHLKHRSHALFLIPGAALVILISVLGTGTVVDTGNMNIGMFLYAVVAGMAAISAMVLPGISGSTLLLTFGLYIPTIHALKQLMHLDFSGLLLIIAIGIGVIAGIVVSVGIIKQSLEQYRGQTIYTVIGMMLGSLYAIVQGPTTLEIPQKAMDIHTFHLLPFIIGILLVGGMQLAKIMFEKHTV